MKHYKEINVYEASKLRIKENIENFEDFYVSFSGGKDSGVLIHLVIEVAKEMNRLPVKVVFSDLEMIYNETERYAKTIMDMEEVEPYWLCLPEIDENASSIYERYYRMWDDSKKDIWAREMPKMKYVINQHNMDDILKKYVDLNDISEWSISVFGEYLCDKYKLNNICNFIGLRANESYGRYMAIATEKNRIKKNQYTYLTKDKNTRTWTSLPIYDWVFADIWYYYSSNKLDYNRVYDKFLKIGIPESEMRTCYALGEEQKKSLWMYSLIEPETFDRLLQRVEGVNFGKLYNTTNINRGKLKKPANISWKQYVDILLAELPPLAKSNFIEKFNIVYRYHTVMYCDKMNLDFDFIACDSRAEEKIKSKEYDLPYKVFFSYETLCGAIIKRDFVMKVYGFGYSNKMVNRVKNIETDWDKSNN
jgi:predicted phosphoadenosine phosphosulfate sulfurtransferase